MCISVYKVLTKKDIIRINQEIGEEGQLNNERSIEDALSVIKKKSWLYGLSFIVRSLLVDHAFMEGNKRTALIIIITYIEDKNLEYDKEKLSKTILGISRKNINDINKIQRLIKSAIIL